MYEGRIYQARGRIFRERELDQITRLIVLALLIGLLLGCGFARQAFHEYSQCAF